MFSLVTVMRDPRSWDADVNVNVVMENYLLLRDKGIADKVFFTRYPKHPEIFMMILSITGFAENLIENITKNGMIGLNNVWFTEYPKEDRVKLVAMGILDAEPFERGKTAIVHIRNGNDYYINVVL